MREFIDYKTIMITDEVSLRGLLGSRFLSHTPRSERKETDVREFIDYKTSMITDEVSPGGILGSQFLSHASHS